MGNARQTEQRIEVRSGRGIPLRIDGVAEPAARVVESQVVDQRGSESMSIAQHHLLAPTVLRAVIGLADGRALDLDDRRRGEPAVQMVLIADGLVDPNGVALFVLAELAGGKNVGDVARSE